MEDRAIPLTMLRRARRRNRRDGVVPTKEETKAVVDRLRRRYEAGQELFSGRPLQGEDVAHWLRIRAGLCETKKREKLI